MGISGDWIASHDHDVENDSLFHGPTILSADSTRIGRYLGSLVLD